MATPQPDTTAIAERVEEAVSRSRQVCGYRKIGDIGSGTYGKAMLVLHVPTGRRCVMKAIDVTKLNARQRQAAVDEVRLLGSLDHPFIIGFQEAFLIHGFLCIITDFADDGDLSAKIKLAKKNGAPFCEHEILSTIAQLCIALRYMHRMHVLHRDIKASNIFMMGDGRIRLGDFGIAKSLDRTSGMANSVVGTPYYLSPEIYGRFPYSWASDIWGLGCVIYEMANLQPPFQAPTMPELAAMVMNGDIPTLDPRYSVELQELYLLMMRKNPAERPGTHTILNHPLLRFHAAELMECTATWSRTNASDSPFFVPLPRIRADSFCHCGAKLRYQKFFDPAPVDYRLVMAAPHPRNIEPNEQIPAPRRVDEEHSNNTATAGRT